jgi:O-antigen/teichoic acid export membrane protein
LEQKQTGLLAGSVAFFVSSLITYAARFATSVIVARTLGVDGKGIYTLVLMIGGLLVLFLSLGLSGSITYLIASGQHKSAELSSLSIVSSIVLSVVGGLLFYIVYIFFLSERFLAGTDSMEIWLVLLSLPINLISLFLSSMLLGKQQIYAYNIINIIRVLSNLAFQLISSLMQGGVLGAIQAWLASNIVAFAVTLWFVRDDLNLRFSQSRKIIRPALSYGSKNYIANLFTYFNYRLDAFLVNYFSGNASVGLYSVGVSTAELLWYVPNAISVPLFPKSSVLEKEVAARLTAQACRQTLLVAALLASIFAAAGPFIIPFVYGSNFQDSVLPFLWLLPGVLSVSLSKLISANLSGLGKPQYATYTSGITVVITLVLDILLIPLYDITGAAIASSLAYIASTILSIIWFSRETGTSWAHVIVPRVEDVTTLAKRTQVLIEGWRKQTGV